MTATQQIEVKDSAARSAQAVDDLRDVQGEKMILNMQMLQRITKK